MARRALFMGYPQGLWSHAHGFWYYSRSDLLLVVTAAASGIPDGRSADPGSVPEVVVPRWSPTWSGWTCWTRRDDLKRVGDVTLLPARGDLPGLLPPGVVRRVSPTDVRNGWVVAQQQISKTPDRVPGQLVCWVGEVRTRTWHDTHNTRILPGLVSPTIHDSTLPN